MLNNSQFIKKLKTDFSKVDFVLAEEFYYSPNQNTIFYNTTNKNWRLLLLHEIGHYLSGHINYKYDRELLKMEVEAWEKVKDSLASKYQIDLDYQLIDSTIATYKNWLYQRSKCPKCSTIGTQLKEDTYHCLNCDGKWQVNQAKFTRLKRTFLTKKDSTI